MTVSSATVFSPTVSSMARRALRLVGAIQEGETPAADMMQDAIFAANSMAKEWEATGLHVWTEEEAIVFLQTEQVRYVIGGSGLAHSSDANDYSLTKLTFNALQGATTVTVDESLTLADGQHIGIVLDNNFAQWTTVVGAPVANVVTLADALEQPASSGNFVYAYTTAIDRPLKIPQARQLSFQGLIENPMLVMARKDYENLPNKLSPGIPTQFFYSPQRDTGELHIWPAPQNPNVAARITWYRPIHNFMSVSNTADFPDEWTNALTWNLAKEIGPEYGVSAQKWAIIVSQAAEKMDMLVSWDRESEPINFQMDWSVTGRP